MSDLLMSKRFLEAGDALRRILDDEGEDGLEKVEHTGLFAELIESAPPEMKKQFSDMAHKLGLFPKTTMVDVMGNSVFSIEEVAKHLDISVEEVLKAIEESGPGITYTGPTSRVQ